MIRSARPNEAGHVLALVRKAYARYVERLGGLEPAPMHADYPALIDEGRVWVADRDGVVVGVLVLTTEPDHIMIENIAVDSSVRGLGVGAQLLAFAETYAREQAVPEVRLFTNEVMIENLAYYPRRGYVETGRKTVDGYQRVFFRKAVRPQTDER
jgi:N-acetylglutamate synthase-like GNAT family acetyltransferase